jgi:hypothetical protein
VDVDITLNNTSTDDCCVVVVAVLGSLALWFTSAVAVITADSALVRVALFRD